MIFLLYSIMSVVLVILKLVGVITCSWALATAMIWAGALAFIGVVIFYTLIIFVLTLTDIL